MEVSSILAFIPIFCGFLVLRWLLRNVNWWLYERPLGDERQSFLPLGDMGLPIIGNMWSFLFAFKSGYPDYFMNSIVTKLVSINLFSLYSFLKMNSDEIPE